MWLLSIALAGPANEAWVAGDHAVAREAWQAQIDEGAVSGDLYYNLGNAHYQLGEVPAAIHAWRTAQLLSPRDGDIEANLGAARKRTEDRIEQPAPETPILFWRTALSAAEQGRASCVLLALFWLLVAGWRLRRLPLAIPAVLTGVPGALLALSTLQSLQDFGSVGVVAQAATIESTASGGVALFELHPGAEVALGDSLGDKVLVALPDGRRGWMSSEALWVVDPSRR